MVVWSTSRSIEVSATIKFSRALSKINKSKQVSRVPEGKKTHTGTLYQPSLSVGEHRDFSFFPHFSAINAYFDSTCFFFPVWFHFLFSFFFFLPLYLKKEKDLKNTNNTMSLWDALLVCYSFVFTNLRERGIKAMKMVYSREILNFLVKKDVRKILKRKDSDAGERGA